MQDKKKKKRNPRRPKKRTAKYRFSIINDETLSEKISLKLSRKNVFFVFGFLTFCCFFCAIIFISITPLSNLIPGRSSKAVQKELVDISFKSDSLIDVLEKQRVYLENIRNIFNGKELFSPKTSSDKSFEGEVSFEKSTEDSLLRIAVEEEEIGSIKIVDRNNLSEIVLFFTPVEGIVVDSFDIKKGHFGIDLVAREKSRISSVLDGVVIFSNWTYETGYVIGVQHKNGYFSLYKHNSVLLRSAGDFVSAGDHIAVIGNSGELSSGPHLHFELWHEGAPIDPQKHISF